MHLGAGYRACFTPFFFCFSENTPNSFDPISRVSNLLLFFFFFLQHYFKRLFIYVHPSLNSLKLLFFFYNFEGIQIFYYSR